jgi:ATP-binding cassette subfamily B protein
MIIAHRLSTVADADRILVMDQGRIIESGRFDELVAKGGVFAKMVEQGGFIEPSPA